MNGELDFYQLEAETQRAYENLKVVHTRTNPCRAYAEMIKTQHPEIAEQIHAQADEYEAREIAHEQKEIDHAANQDDCLPSF